MSYWKCIKATILDNGETLELTFKDSHSCSQCTTALPAETWKNIFVYQMAYEEPEHRMREVHKDLCRFLFDEAKALTQKREGDICK